MRLKRPFSNHCHIFWNSAPINKLILLFSSPARIDHFRSIDELWQTFEKSYSMVPTVVSLFVSPIFLSRGDKAFLMRLENSHSTSKNRLNSICFIMYLWKGAFLEIWESLAHVFLFEPILTILMVFARMRLRWPFSNHCHIFWNSAPINELIPLSSSLTRIDHFRSIDELWQTFEKSYSLQPQ